MAIFLDYVFLEIGSESRIVARRSVPRIEQRGQVNDAERLLMCLWQMSQPTSQRDLDLVQPSW